MMSRSTRLFSILVCCGLIGVGALFALSKGAALSQDKVSQSPGVSVPTGITDEETLEASLKAGSVMAAMDKLVADSKGGSAYDCHQQAHDIGRVGYKIYKEKAFGECNAACHSGCYHGAMESFLHEKGTKNLAANIDSVCKLFKTSFGTFECLHGVGHGVLAYLDYDMPEGLKKCKELGTSFATDSCYGGLFMENVLTGQGLGASTRDHDTKWVNKTNPYFPCDGIDQDRAVQYQCYQMQTSWMLWLENYNFDKVAAQCMKAPQDMMGVCFKSFGRDAAGHTLRNPEKIKEICSKVPVSPPEYYEQCITGAVNVIVDFWGDKLKNQASDLCRILADAGKRVCYSVLGSRIADVFGPSNVFTVRMLEGKFDPEKITIQKNQTVTFVNTGRELHWPASAIHPSHQVYPEFDSKEGIPAGLSWSFTFDRDGEWRFHDHLFAEMKGVVTVE